MQEQGHFPKPPEIMRLELSFKIVISLYNTSILFTTPFGSLSNFFSPENDIKATRTVLLWNDYKEKPGPGL